MILVRDIYTTIAIHNYLHYTLLHITMLATPQLNIAIFDVRLPYLYRLIYGTFPRP